MISRNKVNDRKIFEDDIKTEERRKKQKTCENLDISMTKILTNHKDFISFS